MGHRVGSKRRRPDAANLYRHAYRELAQVILNSGNPEIVRALEVFRAAAIAVYLRPKPRDSIEGWPTNLHEERQR